ncbi:glycosyl transferase [Flavobacterium cheonanense]|uniref:Glycosyl transferase n=1 Tax=Flavobacterium cheonanense TaxID=706183 RepID=A0ABP7W3W4_9FLAO
MNILYKIYYSLPHDTRFGIVSKIINRVAAKVVKRCYDNILPSYFEKTAKTAGIGINKTEERERKYIVSLTSFPARINDVWISIETILRQSYKPDMVLLWLSSDQFKDEKLPQNLLNLQDRGLTIKFIKEDLRSHKKYLYALEEFPNDYIITLDDDLYYEKDLILNLVALKSKYPNCVPTNRAHKLKINFGKVEPYKKWLHNSIDKKPSNLIVQTGGYGTLYSKSDLYKDFNDIEKIKELAPQADDLWMKIMVLLGSKKLVTNSKYNKDPLVVKGTQSVKLVTQNVINGGNDAQLKNMIAFYNITENHFQDEI